MEINKIYTPITEDTRSTKIISQGEFNTGKKMYKNTDKLISPMTAMYEMPKTEITSLLDKYGTKIHSSNEPERDFYSVENGFVKEMNGFAAKSQAEVLRALKKTDIKIAPEFVDNVETAPDTYYSFVKTDFQKLVPYQPNKRFVTDKAKRDFMKDIVKLGKMNIANDSVFKNPNSLFVTPDGAHIVAADWSRTGYLYPQQAAEYFDNIKQIL